MENCITVMTSRTQGITGILTFLFHLIFPGRKAKLEKQKESLLAIKITIEETLQRETETVEEWEERKNVLEIKMGTPSHTLSTPPRIEAQNPDNSESKKFSPSPKQTRTTPFLASILEKTSRLKPVPKANPEEAPPRDSVENESAQKTSSPKHLNHLLPHKIMLTPHRRKSGERQPGSIRTSVSPSNQDTLKRKNLMAGLGNALNRKQSAQTGSVESLFANRQNGAPATSQKPARAIVTPPAVLAKLTQDEPDPIILAKIDYREHTPHEFISEMAKIEDYIKKTKEALQTIEELIQDCNDGIEEINEIDSSLNQLKNHSNQTKDNLKVLEQGLINQDVVSLFLKNSTDSIEIPFYPEKIQAEIQSIDPTIAKDVLFSCLEISKAKKLFEDLIEELANKIKITQNQKTLRLSELAELENRCITNYSKQREDLNSALEQKKTNLKDWAEYSKKCNRLLNSKQSTRKLPIQKDEEDTGALYQICDAYPLIRILKAFSQNIRIQLTRESMGEPNVSQIVDEFAARIYGSLYTK